MVLVAKSIDLFVNVSVDVSVRTVASISKVKVLPTKVVSIPVPPAKLSNLFWSIVVPSPRAV